MENTIQKNQIPLSRIVVTMLLFIMIPIGAALMNIVVEHETISLMCSMNIFGALIIMANWDLFNEHFFRSTEKLSDTLFYIVIGVLVIYVLFYIGNHFLQANILVVPRSTLRAYGYARPGMYIAFGIIQPIVVNICFKLMTDRFDIRNKELQSILISGIVFGAIFTIIFSYNHFSVFFQTYLYNLLLISFLAYLYNQSRSFIPGVVSMSIVYLLVMLLSIVV